VELDLNGGDVLQRKNVLPVEKKGPDKKYQQQSGGKTPTEDSKSKRGGKHGGKCVEKKKKKKKKRTKHGLNRKFNGKANEIKSQRENRRGALFWGWRSQQVVCGQV